METATQDQTPSVGKLADALAKAQGAMDAAKKDAANPHFGSKYANLAAVWEAIRVPLAANGLAVVQLSTSDAAGVTVTTQLLHSSGEWIRDRLFLPVVQKTPQGYGSALTYARRYSLAAMVGVAAEEDDDGNAASGKQVPKAPMKPKPLPTRDDAEAAFRKMADAPRSVSPQQQSHTQEQTIRACASKYGWDNTAIRGAMAKAVNGKKAAELTPGEVAKVCKYIVDLAEPPDAPRDAGGSAQVVAPPLGNQSTPH